MLSLIIYLDILNKFHFIHQVWYRDQLANKCITYSTQRIHWLSVWSLYSLPDFLYSLQSQFPATQSILLETGTQHICVRTFVFNSCWVVWVWVKRFILHLSFSFMKCGDNNKEVYGLGKNSIVWHFLLVNPVFPHQWNAFRLMERCSWTLEEPLGLRL